MYSLIATTQWAEGYTVRGQVIHLNLDRKPARYQEATTVVRQPPMNPSQVFLGDSWMSLRCPKHSPARPSCITCSCVHYRLCFSAWCKVMSTCMNRNQLAYQFMKWLNGMHSMPQQCLCCPATRQSAGEEEGVFHRQAAANYTVRVLLLCMASSQGRLGTMGVQAATREPYM